MSDKRALLKRGELEVALYAVRGAAWVAIADTEQRMAVLGRLLAEAIKELPDDEREGAADFMACKFIREFCTRDEAA